MFEMFVQVVLRLAGYTMYTNNILFKREYGLQETDIASKSLTSQRLAPTAYFCSRTILAG